MNERVREITSAAVLGVGYFAAVGIAVGMTRYDGGAAFLWGATALLLARLHTVSRRKWPAPIIACLIGGVIASSLFGLGFPAAVPLSTINVVEAVIGARLLRRVNGSTDPFESLTWLAGFAAAVGVAAPAAGAAGGAMIFHWWYGQPFWTNWLHWFTGHALGTLTFSPIIMLILRGDAGRWRREAVSSSLVETGFLLTLVVVISAAVFAQETMPLLFMPMLPVILATFRGGRLAAAASIVILALVGGGLTLAGHGPISLMVSGTGFRLQFLQFYLAATLLTILPVAAELERRMQLFHRLRDSEARYRLVTDNSSDVVLNLDPAGIIRFVSPSIGQFGYDPAALIGQNASILVAPDDVAATTAAHLQSLRDPTRTFIVEYRVASDPTLWFETHTRAVLDDKERVTGVVSAARDISHRKMIEEQLALAAMTDPLTGLANRRAFMLALDARLADPGARGCVAMFDLDHFKRVNDSHGHEAGDRVLEQFAVLARAAVREGDLVARLGGEEFAVLLPGLDVEQARLVCERLRREVARQAFALGGLYVAVTVSGGVAAYRAGASRPALLRDADMALYRAKAGGRDRMAVAA